MFIHFKPALNFEMVSMFTSDSGSEFQGLTTRIENKFNQEFELLPLPQNTLSRPPQKNSHSMHLIIIVKMTKILFEYELILLSKKFPTGHVWQPQ